MTVGLVRDGPVDLACLGAHVQRIEGQRLRTGRPRLELTAVDLRQSPYALRAE